MQLIILNASRWSNVCLYWVLLKKPAVQLSHRQMKKSFEEHDFHRVAPSLTQMLQERAEIQIYLWEKYFIEISLAVHWLKMVRATRTSDVGRKTLWTFRTWHRRSKVRWAFLLKTMFSAQYSAICVAMAAKRLVSLIARPSRRTINSLEVNKLPLYVTVGTWCVLVGSYKTKGTF